MIGRSLRALALTLPLAAAGCAPANVDPKEALEVTEVSHGYVDAGQVEGKTRILPSVSFKLRKRAANPDLDVVSVNVAFRKSADESEFDAIYLQRVEIPESGETPAVTVRAETGFTGDPPQTSADMLQHTRFEDLVAAILVKHGSGGWTELQKPKIDRRILPR